MRILIDWFFRTFKEAYYHIRYPEFFKEGCEERHERAVSERLRNEKQFGRSPFGGDIAEEIRTESPESYRAANNLKKRLAQRGY